MNTSNMTSLQRSDQKSDISLVVGQVVERRYIHSHGKEKKKQNPSNLLEKGLYLE